MNFLAIDYIRNSYSDSCSGKIQTVLPAQSTGTDCRYSRIRSLLTDNPYWCHCHYRNSSHNPLLCYRRNSASDQQKPSRSHSYHCGKCPANCYRRYSRNYCRRHCTNRHIPNSGSHYRRRMINRTKNGHFGIAKEKVRSDSYNSYMEAPSIA